MAQGMETTRVYLDANRTGVITCLSCGVKRSMHMTDYGDDIGGKTFRVKCKACASMFDATFDCRRHRRLHVHLLGKLLQLRTRENVDTIVVTSLSVTGLGFVTRPDVVLHKGERYEVVFVLDDEDHSVIFEEIVVQRLHRNIVGAEFCTPEKYHGALGFYIMYETPTPERG